MTAAASTVEVPRAHDYTDVDWLTPEWLLELVREVSFTGAIGTDPCTTAANPCNAKSWLTVAEDGLSKDWSDDLGRYTGLTYVNPPYSRIDSPKWAAKIVEQAAKGLEIIALLPARTDTEWWHLCAPVADAVCFLKGRPRFMRPDGTGPVGSGKVPIAALYYGDRSKVFKRVFETRGWVV